MSLDFNTLWAQAKPVSGPSRTGDGPVKSKAQRFTRAAEEEDIRGEDVVRERISPEDQTLTGGIPTESVIMASAVIGDPDADDQDVLALAEDKVLGQVSRAYLAYDEGDVELEELPVRDAMTPEAWAL